MTISGRLRRAGVLGINRRNAEYTLRWNERRFYPFVDDKLKTKELCRKAGIPTAQLLGVARSQGELPKFLAELASQDAFVIKPARGAMGNGILVVFERDGDRYRSPGGRWVSRDDLGFHSSGIISGLYSLGGQPDAVFAEQCLEIHDELKPIAVEGVPDIRIVVHRGIPVMAMTRLPTMRSRGRANLHQGAVGAGIDLTSGRTTHAVLDNHPTDVHPDTGKPLVDRLMPAFARALEIAVAASDQTGLGYVGADVVVDQRHGPLILELNARPGLAIQMANRSGLQGRLDRVAECWRPGLSAEERIELGQQIGGERG